MRRRLVLVTPARLVLGAVLVAVALAGDSRARSVVLAFVVGVVLVAFAALADRRGVLLSRQSEPEPLPSEVIRDPDWRVLVNAAHPSTFGVTVLAIIGLAAGNEVLGGLLAGVVAGLGVASAVGLVALLAWERERGARLYVGPSGRRYVG